MSIAKKVASLLLCLVLAVGLLPVAPALADESLEAEAGQGVDDVADDFGPDQEDGAVLQNGDDALWETDESNEGSGVADRFSGGQDATREGEDTSAQSDADTNSILPSGLSGIGYVLIERSEVPAGEEQNVVVSFIDEGFILKKATLEISNLSGTKKYSFEANAIISGAVAFKIPGGSLGEGFYQLEQLVVSDAGSSSRIIFDNDSENSYSFAIVSKNGAVDLSSYALDAEGDLVERADVESALGESETAALVSAASTYGRGGDTRAGFTELVVALDPGHGGYDGGASANGLVEKNLNLSIANYAKAELEEYFGVKVVMTRTGDEYVGLTERVERAVAQGANVFVSIHINSGGAATSSNGAEVIIPNKASWYYDDVYVVGSQLGEKILAQLVALGLGDRGTYWKDCTNNERYPDGSLADYFTVISTSHSYGIPGIIVEHAFITNPGDAAFLGNEDNLRALGIADATGIAQQYGLTKVHSSVTGAVVGDSLSISSVFVGGTPTNVSCMVVPPNGATEWIQAYVQPDGSWLSTRRFLDLFGIYEIYVYATINGATSVCGYYSVGYNPSSLDVTRQGDALCITAEKWGEAPANVAFFHILADGTAEWLQGVYSYGDRWTFRIDLTEYANPWGSHHIEAWCSIPGSASFMSQSVDIEVPAPRVSLSASVSGGVASLRASGFTSEPSNASFSLVAPDGSTTWHQASRQSDGSWAAEVDVAGEVGQFGGYTAQVWATFGPSTGSWAAASLLIGYPIMGVSAYSEIDMADLFCKMEVVYPEDVYAEYGAPDIDSFCRIVVEEATSEGVRPEVVFAQAMLETGWLQFNGDVQPDQCNFAGLGAIGGGDSGLSFNNFGVDSVRIGIRAQVQHLKAYASIDPLVHACVDPRFQYVARGSAPYLQDLHGKWAFPAKGNYGDEIQSIIDKL